MARLSRTSVLLLLAASLLALCPGGANAGIGLLNSCPFPVSAFARSGSDPTYSYSLAAGGGYQFLDFGPANLWPAGVIWASRTGNRNNGQATQIEFTIGANIVGTRLDFYDISLVNAYNLPVQVRPLNPPMVSGNNCATLTCIIPNVAAVCAAANTLVGADPACINTDGPGLVATPGTAFFKGYCPQAYSFSKDDATSTFVCMTGTNYQVTFCP